MTREESDTHLNATSRPQREALVKIALEKVMVCARLVCCPSTSEKVITSEARAHAAGRLDQAFDYYDNFVTLAKKSDEPRGEAEDEETRPIPLPRAEFKPPPPASAA